jgi:hypothetical protein
VLLCCHTHALSHRSIYTLVIRPAPRWIGLLDLFSASSPVFSCRAARLLLASVLHPAVSPHLVSMRLSGTRSQIFALLPGCQKFPIGSADETIRSLQVNPEKRTVLPKVAFSGYSSRFKAPEMSEGFDEEVIRIDFQVGSPFRTTTCF